MQFENAPDEQNLNQAGEAWNQPTDSELVAARNAEAGYAVGKQRSNRTTIIFAMTCVIGIGGIYLFSLRTRPKPASAQVQEVETRVDQALARLVDENQKQQSRALFENTQDMVKTFYDYPTRQQVALQELQRNPFSRLLAQDEKADSVEDAQKRRDALRRDLTAKLAELSLQSVLQGPRGATCLIDGEIYTVGAQLGQDFTVKAISPGQVTLTAQEMDFSLEM